MKAGRKIFHLPLADSTLLDVSEEGVKVKNGGMAEIISAGKEPPQNNLNGKSTLQQALFF